MPVDLGQDMLRVNPAAATQPHRLVATPVVNPGAGMRPNPWPNPAAGMPPPNPAAPNPRPARRPGKRANP
jgi:hypothetical protein